jgi:hypothetical protein
VKIPPVSTVVDTGGGFFVEKGVLDKPSLKKIPKVIPNLHNLSTGPWGFRRESLPDKGRFRWINYEELAQRKGEEG